MRLHHEPAGVDQPMLTGAEAVAELLRQAGYAFVFAYPGTSELALCAALTTRENPALVNARGDKEAVFLAAGGNLGGRRCAAILHGARGTTNALGAIADARRSEIPVLCLVGLPSRSSARFLPPHGEPALIDSAGAFAKAAFDCSELAELDATRFLEIVAQAMQSMDEMPNGSVLLGLPQDLLTSRFVPTEAVADSTRSRVEPSEAGLAAALALIEAAQRTAILVDDYLLRTPSAEADLAAFAASLRAPVFQVAYRRGPMLFQQIRSEAVSTYLGQYDGTDHRHVSLLRSVELLITVEDRNIYPRVVGQLPDCPKIALTSNPAATVKNGYLCSSDVLVVGDVSRLMQRLTAQVDAEPEREAWTLADDASWQVDPATSKSASSAVEVVRALGRGLEVVRRPVIVDDSQMFGGLVARHYQYLPGSVAVFGSHGGFVGGGLATAVGLAATRPDLSVVATLGDHGFTNGLQALAAAKDYGLPLLILVCNNGASISLRTQARSDGLRDAADQALANVPGMRYTAIARGYGLSVSGLAWPDPHDTQALAIASRALTAEIEQAMSKREPHLIELTLPSEEHFWAGVWRSHGLDQMITARSQDLA